MDSAKLNDWMQVVGIFAVVASLIFVGLQMKQSQEIAIASQYQERYTAAMEFWSSRQQNEILSRRLGELLIKRHGLPDDMDENTTPETLGAVWADAKKVLLVFDNQHFQYESGFLTEEAWRPYRAGIKRLIDRPIYDYVIQHDRDLYRPSFLSLIENVRQEESNE